MKAASTQLTYYTIGDAVLAQTKYAIPDQPGPFDIAQIIASTTPTATLFVALRN